MCYNQITFKEKRPKKSHKKEIFKNFKEKVDNNNFEWYIIHRYRKKGTEICRKINKKSFKKSTKKVDINNTIWYITNATKKKKAWKQK